VQAQAPKPDPEMAKAANAFVGHWTYEGEYKPGPLGPGGKVTGVYDIKTILGGFFLQDRWTEKGPWGETHGLEIDRYDPVNKNFVAAEFHDDGSIVSGASTFDGKTFNYKATFVAGGKQYSLNNIMLLVADGSFTAKVEISADGKTFVPFMEAKFTKTKAATKD